MINAESIQQFMAITATEDEAAARRFLGITSSLEDAVNLFFESGGEAGLAGGAAGAQGQEGLSGAESAYFAGQDRLEALRREYNSRFSLKRRLSDFIFAKEATNALEFSNAYPRFPLPLEKNALKDLLTYFPFMVERPLLAVYLAPPRLPPAEAAHVEQRLLSHAGVRAFLEEQALLTAALTSHAQARELEALGAELRRAPLLALVGLDVNVNLLLLGALELRAQTDPVALLRELQACLARLAERRRADEAFVQGLGGAEAPRPQSQVLEERRLREDQERNYQQMVQRHAEETAEQERRRGEAQREAALAEQRQQQRRQLARAFTEESVPPEHAIAFLIRLPNGRKLQQTFDNRATFQRVHDFVSTVEEKGFARAEAEFEIRAGFPPQRLALEQRIAQRFPDSSDESIDVRELS